MLASESDRRLLELLFRIPPKLLHSLADKYQIAIPDDITEYGLPDFLMQELSSDQRSDVLSNYAYAGKVVCHYLTTGTKRKVPSVTALQSAISGISEEPEIFDRPQPRKPLLEYAEMDDQNGLLRARFKYFRSIQSIYDQETKIAKSVFPIYYCTVVVRPDRSLAEIRVSDRDMVRPLAYRAMALLKLPSLFPLDLYTERFVRHFLEWVDSLNNARFAFGEAEDISSISLSAKRSVDLRTTSRFKEFFGEGYLRGGHVTIERDAGQIKFRVFFRDTRVTFTSFSSEQDILFVANALEQISEGREFRGPATILDRFFA